MSHTQLCTITDIQPLNDAAYSIRMTAGPIAQTAKTGQFVHILCGHSRLLRRPISICDVAGDELRVVFEVRGGGTEWLARRKVGDQLDVLGPLGHGFDVTGRKILVVGGGIGVPPMLYCAKQAGGTVAAALGFRDDGHSMLVEEFAQVCTHVAVTSDDGSVGEKGYVSTAVERILDKEKDFTDVLVCGPKPMLKAVWQVAERHGVSCQVSMEERMGCGVGACLVCACKTADGQYRHACKDGPVFNAKEVDWNDAH